MMTFTEMREAHVSQIAELEKLCFTTAWSEKSIASELTNDLAVWMVALDGDRVVGYIGSQTAGGETDMMNVAVHPDYRRQGIAQILIELLIPELQRRCSTALSLEVRASNEPAKQLYEKLGFVEVGRRKNYYRDPKEDALILRKEWEI